MTVEHKHYGDDVIAVVIEQAKKAGLIHWCETDPTGGLVGQAEFILSRENLERLATFGTMFAIKVLAP